METLKYRLSLLSIYRGYGQTETKGFPPPIFQTRSRPSLVDLGIGWQRCENCHEPVNQGCLGSCIKFVLCSGPRTCRRPCSRQQTGRRFRPHASPPEGSRHPPSSGFLQCVSLPLQVYAKLMFGCTDTCHGLGVHAFGCFRRGCSCFAGYGRPRRQEIHATGVKAYGHTFSILFLLLRRPFLSDWRPR
jgi:hypothetical protein